MRVCVCVCVCVCERARVCVCVLRNVSAARTVQNLIGRIAVLEFGSTLMTAAGMMFRPRDVTLGLCDF